MMASSGSTPMADDDDLGGVSGAAPEPNTTVGALVQPDLTH
jgi:hypothetical protein